MQTLECLNCGSDVLVEDLEYPDEPVEDCDVCKDWPAKSSVESETTTSKETSNGHR